MESLKRAQFSRIEDQRGTDINFELPEFLKDRNKFSNGGTKLRKTNYDESDSMSLYSNIESLSTSKGELGKYGVGSPQQKPPQPLPRTSLGKSSIKSLPEMASVQSKINNLEQLMSSSSRSNTPINLNLSTQCLPSTTPTTNKNRNSDGYFYSHESHNGNYGGKQNKNSHSYNLIKIYTLKFQSHQCSFLIAILINQEMIKDRHREIHRFLQPCPQSQN